MNTGLSGIFNEISVGKLMKNDSFPQTTNLARINAGIAEMLFGRVNTPKGIETLQFPVFLSTVWFGRVKTPKGIETPAFPSSVSLADVWKDRNPKGDLT